MDRLKEQVNPPIVRALHLAPIILTELAARTAYQSFDKSEHEVVVNYPSNLQESFNDNSPDFCAINEDINSSDISNQLSWVYHHASILEQTNVTFNVQGLGRGVLQEWSRHRIGMSQTVQSSRYTMQDLLYIYIVSDSIETFADFISENNIFTFKVGSLLWDTEVTNLFNSLMTLEGLYKKDFYDYTLSKEAYNVFMIEEFDTVDDQLTALRKCKSKRNVGDLFKSVVTDNWACDLVFTMNLRALKNFLSLRDSGAAWWMMQEFAHAIKEQLPAKYRELVTKK